MRDMRDVLSKKPSKFYMRDIRDMRDTRDPFQKPIFFQPQDICDMRDMRDTRDPLHVTT